MSSVFFAADDLAPGSDDTTVAAAAAADYLGFTTYPDFPADDHSAAAAAGNDGLFGLQRNDDVPIHTGDDLGFHGYPSDQGLDFMAEANGMAYGDDIPNGIFEADDGGDPILPPPAEMEPEEGFVLREWRRQNAILLEEKERREKEIRNEIIVEAEEYKHAFYERRKVNCVANKVHNREREKLFVANQENFHASADKQYWKAIAELIPHEQPSIEKKRGKKDQEKKPSIVVVHGPKPGKPTDLSRMRQIVLKLKHNLPAHLKPSPPPALPVSAKDGSAAGKKPAVLAKDFTGNGTAQVKDGATVAATPGQAAMVPELAATV